MINTRHPYAIGACKNHLGTAGHKEVIIDHEEQERREALDDDIPNDGKQQQLTLASFFTVKGTGSRFSWSVSKMKKHVSKDMETSSEESMEVAEVAVDAAAEGNATELLLPLII